MDKSEYLGEGGKDVVEVTLRHLTFYSLLVT